MPFTWTDDINTFIKQDNYNALKENINSIISDMSTSGGDCQTHNASVLATHKASYRTSYYPGYDNSLKDNYRGSDRSHDSGGE